MKRARDMTALRRVLSMGFVRASANIRVVGIHLNWAFPAHRCLIRRTSSVVLYSSQAGIARRVTKSNKDLQSVMMVAGLRCLKLSSGCCQGKSGT